jgi:hypothetical protein
MQVIFIHIANKKRSRMRNKTDNCQAFETAACTGCHQILWQATIEELKLSTVPSRPDESRFELVPQVYFDNVTRRNALTRPVRLFAQKCVLLKKNTFAGESQ